MALSVWWGEWMWGLHVPGVLKAGDPQREARALYRRSCPRRVRAEGGVFLGALVLLGAWRVSGGRRACTSCC